MDIFYIFIFSTKIKKIWKTFHLVFVMQLMKLPMKAIRNGQIFFKIFDDTREISLPLLDASSRGVARI